MHSFALYALRASTGESVQKCSSGGNLQQNSHLGTLLQKKTLEPFRFHDAANDLVLR